MVAESLLEVHLLRPVVIESTHGRTFAARVLGCGLPHTPRSLSPMPRSNSAQSRDIAYHLHPYTNLQKHESEGSLIIAGGKGVRIFDEDGKEYIEAMAGLWCTALGFGEERLVEAATRQLRRP